MATDFHTLPAQLFREGEKGEPKGEVDGGRERTWGPRAQGKWAGMGGRSGGQAGVEVPWPTLGTLAPPCPEVSLSPGHPEPPTGPCLSHGTRISWKKGQGEPLGRPPPGLSPDLRTQNQLLLLPCRPKALANRPNSAPCPPSPSRKPSGLLPDPAGSSTHHPSPGPDPALTHPQILSDGGLLAPHTSLLALPARATPS